MNAPGPGDSRTVLRRVGGPLLTYHALLLVGAAVLVLGFGRAQVAWEAAGAILIALGIAVEGAILVWTARLTRASTSAPDGRGGPHPTRVGESLCPRCGNVGPTVGVVCPRCGGPWIRRPRAEAGAPEDRPVGGR